jgi:predicted NBD/HSP70 family sugar kinase
VVVRHRIDTESEGGYQHILSRLHSLVEYLKDESGLIPEHIGLGTPGTMDPKTGLMKNCNTTCLNRKSLQKDLEKLLGIPVRLANDANCFALAEYHLGIIAQQYVHAKVVFGVIMGTGVGGGIVVNGEIIGGLHGIGGEWGHMFLDDAGGDCYCGRRGCVETLISGTALQRYYVEQTGLKNNLAAILEDKTNPMAEEIKERLLYYFGKALGQVVNLLDPEVIVLGGGLGKIDFLYDEGLESIERNIFNDVFKTPVVRPLLGDSAGVFGAAMLFQ